MSLIPYYARGALDRMRSLGAEHDVIVSADDRPDGVVVIDIDQAHHALAWLISPLERAENAYLAKLVAERDWPDAQIKARRAELDAMPVEDALAAIRGWTGEPIAACDTSAGGYLFAPERVAELTTALDAVTEATLRTQLDFEAMNAAFLPPDEWLDDGEYVFTSALLPALEALQAFYRAATAAGEAVLIIYC